MTGRIFRSVALVSLLTLIISTVVMMGVSYAYFSDLLERQLQQTMLCVEQGIECSGEEYFVNFISERRVTWIAADGTVLFDTDVNAADMSSHSDREEVQEALESGEGWSARYSSTLSERNVYYAKRLSDGSVLRVSGTGYTVFRLFYSVLWPLCAAIVAVMLLSLILAMRISRRIVRPINAIDPDRPESAGGYEELSPLMTKLRRQNSLISKQMTELTQKRDEFTAITENMSEGFIITDAEKNILSYNSSALQILGLNDPARGLTSSPETDQAVTMAINGTAAEREFRMGEKYYRVLANPVLNDGKPSGAVAIILDVTEKLQREAMRREFSSNVSHELKTPLTTIRGAAEMLCGGMVKQDDVQSFAGMIYNEADRLIVLIEDIIRLSRLDEDGVESEKTSVDLFEIAAVAAERIKNAAAVRNVTVELSGGSVCVIGDRNILEDMIYNLCDNAVKYNKVNGSVTVTVTVEENRPTITIEDTGIGIPRDKLGRVFERFYRVDKSRSKAIGGTGLGLSIAKHAAAYHNAEISIESTEGVGTRLTIRFPAEQ